MVAMQAVEGGAPTSTGLAGAYESAGKLPEFTEAADFALDAEAEDEAKAIAA